MVRLALFGYFLLAILLVIVTSGGIALGQSKAARKGTSTLHPQGIQGQGADWLSPLFGTQRQFRDITGAGTQQLNELDKFQQDIMEEFGTLEPTQPTGKGRRRGRSRP